MDPELGTDTHSQQMKARTGRGEASDDSRMHLERLLPAVTYSPEETVYLGADLAAAVAPGDVVALIGELGSGKTHLIKGITNGLGGDEGAVTSPTFTIAHEYEADIPVAHLDLYRLKGPDDVRAAGLVDYIEFGGVCLIEWPDRAGELLPPETIVLRLTHAGRNHRRIEYVPLTTGDHLPGDTS